MGSGTFGDKSCVLYGMIAPEVCVVGWRGGATPEV